MRKLRVIAFLAAVGLFAFGCGIDDNALLSGSESPGGGGGAPAGLSGNEADKQIRLDEKGNTTNTIFIDPTTGTSVASISDIKSSATGKTPPAAPTFARQAGSVPVPPIGK